MKGILLVLGPVVIVASTCIVGVFSIITVMSAPVSVFVVTLGALVVVAACAGEALISLARWCRGGSSNEG